MQSRELVIAIRTLNPNGISTSSTIALSSLVMLLLILLDLLRSPLALVIEFLILSLDLGLAMLGVSAAAAGTVFCISQIDPRSQGM